MKTKLYVFITPLFLFFSNQSFSQEKQNPQTIGISYGIGAGGSYYFTGLGNGLKIEYSYPLWRNIVRINPEILFETYSRNDDFFMYKLISYHNTICPTLNLEVTALRYKAISFEVFGGVLANYEEGLWYEQSIKSNKYYGYSLGSGFEFAIPKTPVSLTIQGSTEVGKKFQSVHLLMGIDIKI